MILFFNKTLIICYSTPNYSKLTEISLKSLYNLNIKPENIRHKLDIPPEKLFEKDTGFMSDLFHYCIIEKVKHLINMLIQNKNKYEYFISLDLDIWFLENNKHQWNNLKSFIDYNDNDIFFMRENYNDEVNGGFFIIKNKNIDIIINFLSFIYINLILKTKQELPMLEQQLINENKYQIKYDYIPNEYVIFGEDIFNQNKSLFHHSVCCRNVDEKIIQINSIKDKFKV